MNPLRLLAPGFVTVLLSCGVGVVPAARALHVSAASASVTIVQPPSCAQLVDYCPGLSEGYCAIEAAHAKHDDCQVDEDCVFVSVEPQCTEFGMSCPPPSVNVHQQAAFRADDAAARAAYCVKASGCLDEGQCAHAASAFSPRCINQHCAATLSP